MRPIKGKLLTLLYIFAKKEKTVAIILLILALHYKHSPSFTNEPHSWI